MNRRLPVACALAVSALAACASPAVTTPTPMIVARASCHTGPYTLWLDFDGVSVAHASADDATTTPVQSLLAQSSVMYPAFDGSIAAPSVTRQQAIDSIVDRVRNELAPYNIDVATTRPASAPYSVVLVGGANTDIGAPAGESGLANEDCDNLDDRDVSYAFAAELDPRHGGVVATANTVLHEVGHAFGLLHTVAQDDLMYSVAAPTATLPEQFTLHYGMGDYSSFSAGSSVPVPRPCAGSDPVDNAALLACNAGTSAPAADTTPPTLTWDLPSGTVTSVSSPLSVSFTAADDTAVARLELYKNLELVAVLAAPPYTASVSADPGEQFFVTVVAIDAAANRTVLSREFTALGGGDLGPAVVDMAAPTMKHHGGCSLGGAATGERASSLMMLMFVLLLFVLLGAWRVTASSRSSPPASPPRPR